ncbi:SAM-dependent methyltransferase [Actinomadura barringtoniae]|uniref:SAM-dependent methyltransferase n=1 Tax=Actinomadura barringtoniae TaxID=1427535 RepID=A0A939TAB2_9ACTN|nr:SAM-dependent methyltransferase [Actinomadura barringtoniae]MBO2455214.1 SAM-dependent methyltransferase [Actinomadura barringtoniae]
MTGDETERASRAGINTNVPHAPRIWNYWVGGKDNYAADREVGDRMAEMYPEIVHLARADRAFLGRAVRYLAGEAGVEQFLDIGTGLPTASNTHEVAQTLNPRSRVVYVDNDPLVLTHARAVLGGTPEGATAYIEADLHDPGRILREAAATLDFDKPVALMLLGVLIYVPETQRAYEVVRELVDAVPPGSHLVIAHSTSEVYGEATEKVVAHRNQFVKPAMTLRSGAEIERFFEGLELLEPGVVSCSRWRPDPTEIGEVRDVDEFAGVARKP